MLILNFGGSAFKWRPSTRRGLTPSVVKLTGQVRCQRADQVRYDGRGQSVVKIA